MTFDAFDLPSPIPSNIKALGYVSPTPIQERAVPAGLTGRDLMGLAQTGTGKTAAFLLPILSRLLRNKPRHGDRRNVRALILAPTRELAEQIFESATALSRNSGLRCTTVYGGVAMSRQLNALRQGVDLVVACPGRLLDHMGQRTVDLRKVEVLVLDEADQMFDMGFLPGIRQILAALPKERQTMLFSATMPDAIRTLSAECLTDPETVSVGHDAPASTVSHAIYPVSQHLKTRLLQELLERNQKGSVLVFTRTKHRAKRLAETLAKSGHSAAAIQGNLSQNQRKAAMDGFRSGRYRVLVATDIAARGIDVNLVEHVVNYDVPSTPETYTHRIGRTGRAERTGEAHTFVIPDDASMVRAIERLLREPLKRKRLEGFDYNAPMPKGESEFSRPPLEPRGRQGQPRRDGQGGGYGRQDSRPARPFVPKGKSGTSDRPGDMRGDVRSDSWRPGDEIYSEDRPRAARPGQARSFSDRPYSDRPARAEGGRPQGVSAPREARNDERRDERRPAGGERREPRRDDRPGQRPEQRAGQRTDDRPRRDDQRPRRDDRRDARPDSRDERRPVSAAPREGQREASQAPRQDSRPGYRKPKGYLRIDA